MQSHPYKALSNPLGANISLTVSSAMYSKEGEKKETGESTYPRRYRDLSCMKTLINFNLNLQVDPKPPAHVLLHHMIK